MCHSGFVSVSKSYRFRSAVRNDNFVFNLILVEVKLLSFMQSYVIKVKWCLDIVNKLKQCCKGYSAFSFNLLIILVYYQFFRRRAFIRFYSNEIQAIF
jgi:hypothetical protein